MKRMRVPSETRILTRSGGEGFVFIVFLMFIIRKKLILDVKLSAFYWKYTTCVGI